MTARTKLTDTLTLAAGVCKRLAPPPRVSMSEWADMYRRLSKESSAEPGRWRTDRAPYQRGIMDAISDPGVQKVVVMMGAQTGKTEALLNTIAYYMHFDPAPILMVQPTDAMGEYFSKRRLAPMLRDTPVLRGLVKDPRSRDGDNTLSDKSFPGGYIAIAGANSPKPLSGRPIRILLFDEVDRAPASAGTEGAPVMLATQRTANFWNRKIIMTSTPGIKGESRIEQDYLDSSQEEWHLPCPSCGEMQPLKWEQLDFETVMHACKYCGVLHKRRDWLGGKGEWIAKDPYAKVRGFHVNALASPWAKWEDLIDEFVMASKRAEMGDFEKLKAFINLKLGQTWEERGERVDENELMSRRESYNAEIPDGVCVLTCGVDVQDSRLCYEIVGYGAGKESWGIEYGELWGDPRQLTVWTQLDNVLTKPRYYASGRPLPIICTCIDSGGHCTSEVYSYTKARQRRNVYAIKGQGGEGLPLVKSSSRTQREHAILFILGVDTGKNDILSRLRIRQAGPGYCHFPRGEKGESVSGYDDTFFAGIMSEKRVRKLDRRGRAKYEWVVDPGVRNEPFDCRNYANAALSITRADLDRMAEREPWKAQGSASSAIVQKPKRNRNNGAKSGGIKV